jgi:hypothetical protein
VAEQPSEPNGSTRPSLPWILFAISTAVAVLATSGFVYLLTKRTTGPAEVLQDFYQAVHNQDCDGSLSLMTAELRAEVADGWCDFQFRGGPYPPTVSVRETSLENDLAVLLVEEPGGCRLSWHLVRADRTWLIADLPPGGMRHPGKNGPTQCEAL